MKDIELRLKEILEDLILDSYEKVGSMTADKALSDVLALCPASMSKEEIRNIIRHCPTELVDNKETTYKITIGGKLSTNDLDNIASALLGKVAVGGRAKEVITTQVSKLSSSTFEGEKSLQQYFYITDKDIECLINAFISKPFVGGSKEIAIILQEKTTITGVENSDSKGNFLGMCVGLKLNKDIKSVDELADALTSKPSDKVGEKEI